MSDTGTDATPILEDATASNNLRSDAVAKKTVDSEKQGLLTGKILSAAAEESSEGTMQHVRKKEDETLPNVNLIDLQPEFQWLMRMDLIDFLVEAHVALTLLPETLFLAVNLLDRYSSKRIVHKRNCALVGCVVLLVAAKYGDLRDNVPRIDKLNTFCCGSYTNEMFVRMEMHVLHTLEWNIGHPTVEACWPLMVTEGHFDQDLQHMARYICQIALYHRDFVSTKPMTMARASLHLANGVLSGCMLQFDELNPSEISTLLSLSQHLRHASPTLFRKFSTQQCFKASGRLADFVDQAYVLHGNKAKPLMPIKYYPVPISHQAMHLTTRGSNTSRDAFALPQKPGLAAGGGWTIVG